MCPGPPAARAPRAAVLMCCAPRRPERAHRSVGARSAHGAAFTVYKNQGQTKPKLPGTPTVYSLYHSAGTRAQSHAQGELCVCPLAWPFTLATAAVPRAESRPSVSTRSRVPCRQVHRLRVADRAACRPFPATDHHHSSIIISTAAAAAAAAAATARSPQRPRCAVVVVVVS